MFKPLQLLFVAALGFGAWYFFTHFRVQGWEDLRIEPAAGPAGAGAPQAGQGGRPAALSGRKSIRIACANFGPLDRSKLGKPAVAAHLAQIVRQFELLALQDVAARDQGLLVQLVELANAPGRHYNFVTAPQVGRDPVQQYSAFVFDADAVQVDRVSVALVEDRAGQFLHSPLVASFRALGPAENEAFTFTLVNVHTPADRVAGELNLLAAVFRAVRDSGRGEDDVILLGEIGTDETRLGPLARLPNLLCAVSGLPTTMQGSRQVDNILFDRRATVEFTHRSGVYDLMRELSLSAREAAEVSDHLPVWAEFSVYEGGQAGHVAAAR